MTSGRPGLADYLSSMASNKVDVWDIGIRAFHWLLVVAVLAALLTGLILGLTTLRWHLIAGASIAALLLWRIVWGLLGGPYARFSGFAYAPRTVLAYARGLRRGSARYVGHNPLGATMVFALLLVLTVIVAAGTITLGGMLKQGPLRAVLTYAAGRQGLQVHNLLAYLLLAMLAGHLWGVAFESWRERENLVRAMLTGRKRPGEAPPTKVRAFPLAAVGITLAIAAGSGAGIAVLASLPGRGVPPTALDPVYAEQCAGCHIAYPPSLAPAATWNAILDDIDNHFDAAPGLPPDIVAHIRAYLDANDASHWDTLASHRLRTPAPHGSQRITESPGWRRIHRAIPAAIFTSPPVYRRSHCDACHADAATGLFAPQRIAIPEPTHPAQ